MKINFFILSIVFVFISCGKVKSRSINDNLPIISFNYSNASLLKKVIDTTSVSSDTIFLGLRINMTKEQVLKQINNLKKDSVDITFSERTYNTYAGLNYDLGKGYTLKVPIKRKDGGNFMIGNAEYFVKPIYNKNFHLRGLNIITFEEKWNNNIGGNHEYSWLEERIKKNTKSIEDSRFNLALNDYNVIESMAHGFFRHKNKAIVYKTDLSYVYVDYNYLMKQLLFKMNEIEIGVAKSNKLEF